MRTAILATLALLPLAAHSQATAASSPALQAKLTPPAHMVRASDTATTATTTTSLASAHAAPVMHESIKTSLVSPQMQHVDGSLSYNFLGDTESAAATPSLVHVVGRVLPAVDEKHPDAYVAVTLTVDLQGNPENIKVTKSANPAVDASTVAAVRQYRFKPAVIGNQPVESDVAIEVKLSK